MMQQGITYCICTYNRSAYLERCLASLLPQIDDVTVKIMVIDNASPDDTQALVNDLINQGHPITYIHEPKQGLSVARNTGWQQTDTEWIFYIDDDCLAPDGFVSNALKIKNSQPSFDVYGGPIEAIFTAQTPDWLPEGFGNFRIDAADLKKLERGYVRGGCFLIRRSVLAKLGGFNESLGMKGNMLRYAEELELQDRIRQAGHAIAYAPQLHIYHYVRPDKLTVSWVMSSEYARRRDKVLIDRVSVPRASINLTRTIVSRFFWIPFKIGTALLKKDYSVKKAMVEGMLPLMYRYGEWRGSIMNKKNR